MNNVSVLEKGTKIKLVKPFEILGVSVGNVGDIYTITEIIGDNFIFFESENGNGTVTMNNFDKHFEVYVEPAETKYTIECIAPTVTQEHIDAIIEASDVAVTTAYDKCTVVNVKLPNGFVITESSACVDPRNYDKEMGIEICMEKIKNKLWELEGYKLQCELYEASEAECECEECCCFDDCDEVKEYTFTISGICD